MGVAIPGAWKALLSQWFVPSHGGLTGLTFTAFMRDGNHPVSRQLAAPRRHRPRRAFWKVELPLLPRATDPRVSQKLLCATGRPTHRQSCIGDAGGIGRFVREWPKCPGKSFASMRQGFTIRGLHSTQPPGHGVTCAQRLGGCGQRATGDGQAHARSGTAEERLSAMDG